MSGIFIVFDNHTNSKKNLKYLESAKLLEHRGNQELVTKKFEMGQLFFYRLKTEESLKRFLQMCCFIKVRDLKNGIKHCLYILLLRIKLKERLKLL